MECRAKIKEMFTSIQGEGPIIGYQQLFIRFCGCNLKCDFCDTDFEGDENAFEFTPQELAKEIEKFDLKNIHSISLTGGEPLLSVDFLNEFIPLVDKKFYLETNGTLAAQYLKIKDKIDIVAADIKLPSTSGLKNAFSIHEKFFEVAKDCFAKIVFDDKITDEEINECIKLAQKNNIELVLQPKMIGEKMSVTSDFIEEVFHKFLSQYPKVRVIPQVHKFLSVQ